MEYPTLTLLPWDARRVPEGAGHVHSKAGLVSMLYIAVGLLLGLLYYNELTDVQLSSVHLLANMMARSMDHVLDATLNGTTALTHHAAATYAAQPNASLLTMAVPSHRLLDAFSTRGVSALRAASSDGASLAVTRLSTGAVCTFSRNASGCVRAVGGAPSAGAAITDTPPAGCVPEEDCAHDPRYSEWYYTASLGAGGLPFTASYALPTGEQGMSSALWAHPGAWGADFMLDHLSSELASLLEASPTP